MNNFDAGNWIAEQALALPQVHIVAGVPFDLLQLGLDEDLLEKVKAGESYNDMVFLAADSGLAYYDANGDACRVADNKHLGKKIKGIWEKEELHLETEPCMKERVGLIVCEISGLTELVEEQRELDAEIKKEEDDRAAEAKRHLTAEGENHLDGNDLPPSDTDLDNLAQANLDRDALKIAS